MSDLIKTRDEYEALLLECKAQVKFYVDLANKKLNISLPYPLVTFGLSGTTAGRAWYGKNLIQFQPTLLVQNPDDFLIQTTGHEVGHLAAFRKYGKIKPHGSEWGSVMWTMGLPANRCHNYDHPTLAAQTKKPPLISKGQLGQVVVTGVGKVTELD